MTIAQFAVLIASLAAALMSFCFFMVLDLRKRQPEVQVYWTRLAMLIGVFVISYAVLIFFPSLPPNVMFLVVALVFMLGAVYVLLTIRLIRGILDEYMNDAGGSS